MPRIKYGIELSNPDNAMAYAIPGGAGICLKSDFRKAMIDCCRTGDCEAACRYVLSHFRPVFTIVKKIAGVYQSVPACHEDKILICQSIYFESDRDFRESEEWCDIYLVWEAANNLYH